jgi:hypothetical protein
MADQNRDRGSSGDEMDHDESLEGSSGSQRGSSRGSSGRSSGGSSRGNVDDHGGYGSGSRPEGMGDEDELTSRSKDSGRSGSGKSGGMGGRSSGGSGGAGNH